MDNKYENVEITVIHFESEDIIVTSTNGLPYEK